MMDVIFLVKIFRLYLKVKAKLFHNCTQKILFLSACYRWDGTISLRELNQKNLHGGKIGYGDSYLVYVFRYSKVFLTAALTSGALFWMKQLFINKTSCVKNGSSLSN